MNIGFIGLGIMGTPMAGHLRAAGHALFVTTRSKLPQGLLDAGAVACKNAGEVARAAEVIFLMLPDTPGVEAVLFGVDGVASGQQMPGHGRAHDAEPDESDVHVVSFSGFSSPCPAIAPCRRASSP